MEEEQTGTAVIEGEEGSTEEKNILYQNEGKESTEDESGNEENKAEGEEKKDDSPSDSGEVIAPITAEDITFPEDVKIDAGIQDKLLELMNNNEMGVKEKTQALIDLQQSMYDTQVENAKQQKADQILEWEKEVSSDRRFIGATGDKLEETLTLAKKGMEVLNIKGLPELMSLEQTGFGSHPVFVDLFTELGKRVSEDTFKTGGLGGSSEPKPDKEVLYGKK